MNSFPLWRNKLRRAAPAGYCCGATLTRLLPALARWSPERLSAGRLRLALPGGVEVRITEAPRPLFLAHLVSCRFRVQGATRLNGPLRLLARDRGWLRRRGMVFYSRHSHPDSRRLLAALNDYPQIAARLSALDFRHWEMVVEGGRWWLEIEPFAASEVVSRLPPGRRWLRLVPDQQHALLSVLLMFSQLMARIDEQMADETTGERR